MLYLLFLLLPSTGKSNLENSEDLCRMMQEKAGYKEKRLLCQKHVREVVQKGAEKPTF